MKELWTHNLHCFEFVELTLKYSSQTKKRIILLNFSKIRSIFGACANHRQNTTDSTDWTDEKREKWEKNEKSDSKSCIIQNFVLSLGREFITIHDIEASLNSLFAFTKTAHLT